MNFCSKADLIKAMKSDKAGFHWNWFSWAPGLLTDGSNQYETESRIDISPFVDNYIGLLSSVKSIDKITVICDFAGKYLSSFPKERCIES